MNAFRIHLPALSSTLCLLAATLGLATACATEEAKTRPAATDRVTSLTGDAACSSDAQCRTIGVGNKACGGPERYLAWSTLRTDGAALQAAVDQQALARRAEQRARGAISTCSVVPDPGAYCAIGAGTGAAGAPPGVCQLHSTRPGQAPTR